MNATSTTFTNTGESLPADLFAVSRENWGYLRGTRHQLSRSGYLTVLAFMLGMVMVIAAIGFNDYYVMLQLPSQGRDAKATITNLWYTTGKSTTYHVSFTFHPDAKVSTGAVTAQQIIGSGTYYRLSKGQSVSVRYLPNNPSQVRLSGTYQDDGNVWGNVAIVAILGIGIAILLIAAFREMDRNARLMRDGNLILGQLLLYRGYKGYKGHYYIDVTVGFQTPDGRLIQKSVTKARGDLRNAPKLPTGTPVAVLYVDDNFYKIL